MSERVPDSGHRLPHLPALDGLRGLAVIAVLLYHSEFSWAKGGHLGVTAFFVLSGFLITSLLLLEHQREGRISLRAFWGRRARRLVPAALIAVALGGLWLGYGASRPGRGAFGDGVASLFWVANWRFILQGSSYGDLFSEPSPFRHFWSLAIEEQFYVVLPLVVVGVLALAGSRRSARLALAGVFAVAVGVSTELASLLHAPGDAPTRAYYGTDARLAEPALGALLAVVLVGGGAGLRVLSRRWRVALDVAGVCALAGLVLLGSSLSVWSPRLYDGGFLLAALLAAVVIAAATQPGALVARALGPAVLRAVGTISYGIYLFHWPVFLWVTGQSTGLDDARLLLVRSTVTVTLAGLSYALIEQPVRLGALVPRVAGAAWANGVVAIVAGLALFTGTVTWPAPAARSVEVASGFESGAGVPARAPSARGPASGARPASAPAAAVATPAPSPLASTPPPPAPARGAASHQQQAASSAGRQTRQPAPTAAKVPTRYRIAFIGDSVSQNLAGGMQRWGAQQGVEVLDLSKPGCPISRGGERRFSDGHPWPIDPSCDWWDDAGSEEWDQLRSFSADVIVLHDGTNELADRKLPQWPKWMRPGEPVFDTWLTGEYRSIIDASAQQKIPLLLLNVPCADWNRYDNWRSMSDPAGRVSDLNRVVYHEIGTSATKVVDLFSYLCPDGEFTTTVDGVADARPDGFHLSQVAAERAAERLLAPAAFELADRGRAGPTP